MKITVITTLLVVALIGAIVLAVSATPEGTHGTTVAFVVGNDIGDGGHPPRPGPTVPADTLP